MATKKKKKSRGPRPFVIVPEIKDGHYSGRAATKKERIKAQKKKRRDNLAARRARKELAMKEKAEKRKAAGLPPQREGLYNKAGGEKAALEWFKYLKKEEKLQLLGSIPSATTRRGKTRVIRAFQTYLAIERDNKKYGGLPERFRPKKGKRKSAAKKGAKTSKIGPLRSKRYSNKIASPSKKKTARKSTTIVVRTSTKSDKLAP